MELHELHIGQQCARFVGDRHAIARGHFRVRRLPVDLPYPSVPHSISCVMYFGPSSTNRATASVRHKPSPALMVSCSCSPISSSSERATAIPPCAQAVAESLKLDFARTSTLPAALNSIAARKPAIPLPTTA